MLGRLSLGGRVEISRVLDAGVCVERGKDLGQYVLGKTLSGHSEKTERRPVLKPKGTVGGLEGGQ